jgi:predicted secreted protein
MAKYTGKGSEFQIRTVVSPEAFATVAQVRRIGSISLTSDEIEATTLDTAGDFRSFLQGFKDAGELAIEVIWDPTVVTHGSLSGGLYGLFTSGETKVFRIKIPVSPLQYLRLNGFIRDFELPELNVDDPIAVTATIRLSDNPALGGFQA